MEYDLIIIGGGPAALTAGIYAARKNLKTLILYQALGGQMSLAPSVENYPGVSHMHGMKLAEEMKKQAEDFGCELRPETVVELRLKGEIKNVKTSEGEYSSKAVIVATGSHYRKLDAEGEEKFIGKGVSYCAVCDGYCFKGKRVAVIGGSDAAVKSAVYLSEIASETFLVHRRDQLRAEEANQELIKKSRVKIIWNSVVEKVDGDKLVRKIIIRNVSTNEKTELALDGVFIEVGEIPTTELVKAAGVEVNEKNFIKVDDNFRTNIPGVFAAGDVTGSFAQIVVAASSGAEAATSACVFLRGGAYGSKPADYGEKK